MCCADVCGLKTFHYHKLKIRTKDRLGSRPMPAFLFATQGRERNKVDGQFYSEAARSPKHDFYPETVLIVPRSFQIPSKKDSVSNNVSSPTGWGERNRWEGKSAGISDSLRGPSSMTWRVEMGQRVPTHLPTFSSQADRASPWPLRSKNESPICGHDFYLYYLKLGFLLLLLLFFVCMFFVFVFFLSYANKTQHFI